MCFTCSDSVEVCYEMMTMQHTRDRMKVSVWERMFGLTGISPSEVQSCFHYLLVTLLCTV